MTADTLVLGAGPAGLGAAIALGRRAIVLEAAPEVAGLSRTLVLDGAVFDLGGHSFHTPHPAVRRLVFDALAMQEQRRDAWCHVAGAWVPYPFQQHFADHPDPALRAACAAGLTQVGLANAGDWRAAPDFDAYLDRRFGAGIAGAFMRPYNRKLWGPDLARMAADWTGERVAGPAGAAQRFAEQGGQRTPLQSDTTVAYPARGGFGEIFRALAEQVADLRLGRAVLRIDPARRRLHTATGETFGWRRIISTMPLPDLLGLLPDVPADIEAGVAGLEALAVSLVMVVLDGQGRTDRQRVYLPGPELPGHKLVFNHTSSDWLRARKRHGIQLEVAGAARHDTARLAAAVVAGLLGLGLIGRACEVRRVEVLRLALGYPVPTHGRAAAVRAARHWLEQRGIALVGRFAEWDYINADAALARGLEVGDALVQAA